MSQIPVVDKDTASRLGSKKLGEMTDLVSQFEIQENYTQINYKGDTVPRDALCAMPTRSSGCTTRRRDFRHTLLSIWSIRILISSGCPPA